MTHHYFYVIAPWNRTVIACFDANEYARREDAKPHEYHNVFGVRVQREIGLHILGS